MIRITISGNDELINLNKYGLIVADVNKIGHISQFLNVSKLLFY